MESKNSMKQRTIYKNCKQAVLEKAYTAEQIMNADRSQVEQIFGIDLAGYTDAFLEALKGNLIEDMEQIERQSGMDYIKDTIKQKWPDIEIEDGDSRLKPSFIIWPLGRPEEPAEDIQPEGVKR